MIKHIDVISVTSASLSNCHGMEKIYNMGTFIGTLLIIASNISY